MKGKCKYVGICEIISHTQRKKLLTHMHTHPDRHTMILTSLANLNAETTVERIKPY